MSLKVILNPVVFLKVLISILSALFFYLCVKLNVKDFLAYMIAVTAFGYGVSMVEGGVLSFLIHKGRINGFPVYCQLLSCYIFIASLVGVFLAFWLPSGLKVVDSRLFCFSVILVAVVAFNIRAIQYILGDRTNQVGYLYIVLLQIFMATFLDGLRFLYPILLLPLISFQILILFFKREAFEKIRPLANSDKSYFYYIFIPIAPFVFFQADKLFLSGAVDSQIVISLMERVLSATSIYLPFVASYWADSRKEGGTDEGNEVVFVLMKYRLVIMLSISAYFFGFPIAFYLIMGRIDMGLMFLGCLWFLMMIISNSVNIALLKTGRIRLSFVFQVGLTAMWVLPKMVFENLSVELIIMVNIFALFVSSLFVIPFLSEKGLSN